ncbi:helix-turn-helix transcriptional regulator [Polaromonas glacialis]|nr:helix-turn-helix transcriptional regulator [Polaromonas glacialis]
MKADRHQNRALELVAAGQSYREVDLPLSISKRDRAKQATITG